MFERFTPQARRALVQAQDEARALGHDHIGTEHLLFGLAGADQGVSAEALQALGIGPATLHAELERRGTGGPADPAAGLPFTPQAKNMIESSLREALHFGSHHIGTEHLLLGLIRQGKGPGVEVLAALGADPGRVRQQVIDCMRGFRDDADLELPRPGHSAPAGRGRRTLKSRLTRS
jgi:ATP-dependent Clp protease ATP-binding subunit ClpC